MKYKEKTYIQEKGLDLTPLLDIIFLVLIFFMVAATFDLNRSMKMSLPQSFTGESDISPKNILIEVGKDGIIALNGNEVLISVLSGELKSYPDYEKAAIYVLGDEGVPYQAVIEVLDVLQFLSIQNISLVTTPKNTL